MKKYFPSSELIINEDGSVFHLHVKPEWLVDKVILVGDPGRVALVASHFENKECEVESREFKTITGTYKGKRITVVSTGIGCDNIDIVMNELDALANIDFVTREEKDQFRQLELVRIGTCGGLQPNTPVGTFVCSQKSIGFDGLLNFYAGRNAFSEAFKNAGPKILEPIYDVEVFVPSDRMGDVMGDLQGRRAMIMGMSSEKGFEKLVAKVPLKEMSSYSTALSSLTGGRASFIMKFSSYELVPTDVQDKLMKDFEAKQIEE